MNIYCGMMGIPHEPKEVKQLYKLCQDHRPHTLDCAEGFCLLTEFWWVTIRHHLLWDSSMQTVMDFNVIPESVPYPFDSKHDVWSHSPIPRLFNGRFKRQCKKFCSIGLAAPDATNMFDVDA